MDLPVELEVVALVDGVSAFQAFTNIALRLAAPAMVVTLMIVLAFSWNEFLFALTLAPLKTILVLMAGAVDTRGVQLRFVAVRTLLAIIPPTVLALLAQRYIVRGLTFGAVKG